MEGSRCGPISGTTGEGLREITDFNQASHTLSSLIWSGKSSLAAQRIPCILWNPMAHCHIHTAFNLSLNLSQISPVHAFPSPPLYNINIIFPSKSRSSEWSLSFTFTHQNLVYISLLSHTSPMPLPSQPLWFCHPTTWWRVQILELCIMQSPSVSYYFLHLRPKYLPQHLIFRYLQHTVFPVKCKSHNKDL